MKTPIQTKALLMAINMISEYKFENSSYGNDACDSMYCHDLGMKIFVPNVEDEYEDNDGNERYTTFAISFDDDRGSSVTIDHDFSLLEVFSIIHAIRDRWVTVNGNPTSMCEFVKANAEDYATIKQVLRMPVDEEIGIGHCASTIIIRTV